MFSSRRKEGELPSAVIEAGGRRFYHRPHTDTGAKLETEPRQPEAECIASLQWGLNGGFYFAAVTKPPHNKAMDEEAFLADISLDIAIGTARAHFHGLPLFYESMID